MVPRRKKSKVKSESDSTYILKIVLYFIIGSQWVWITSSDGTTQVPLPVGLVIGLIFIRHERFQIDRKIEYAVLLVAMIIGFWAQIGVFIR